MINLDSDGEVTGKIKVAFVLEVVREKDESIESKPPIKFGINHPLADPLLQRHALLNIVRQAKKELPSAGTIDYRDEGDFTFPVTAVVHRILVSELDSVHRFTKNSPYVSITCGDWAASTSVRGVYMHLCSFF